jgi:adenylate kinase
LLDGYPRTADQVEELDDILAAAGTKLDVVVQLTADTDEVVRRLLNRALEQGRADDTEDVIRRRLEVYEEQTAPLTSVYAQRGLVVLIDGLGEVAEVTGRILEALDARGLTPAN